VSPVVPDRVAQVTESFLDKDHRHSGSVSMHFPTATPPWTGIS